MAGAILDDDLPVGAQRWQARYLAEIVTRRRRSHTLEHARSARGSLVAAHGAPVAPETTLPRPKSGSTICAVFAPTKSVPAGESSSHCPMIVAVDTTNGSASRDREARRAAGSGRDREVLRPRDRITGGEGSSRWTCRSVPLTVVESIGPVGFPTFACRCPHSGARHRSGTRTPDLEQIFARDVGCDRRQDHRHGHGDGTAGRTTAWVGQRVRIDPEAAARPILVTLTVWLPSTDTVLTVVVPPT